MAEPTLAAGQYSIGTEVAGGDPATVVYGWGTSNLVQNTAIDPGNPTYRQMLRQSAPAGPSCTSSRAPLPAAPAAA